jgi:hypothetical protein
VKLANSCTRTPVPQGGQVEVVAGRAVQPLEPLAARLDRGEHGQQFGRGQFAPRPPHVLPGVDRLHVEARVVLRHPAVPAHPAQERLEVAQVVVRRFRPDPAGDPLASEPLRQEYRVQLGKRRELAPFEDGGAAGEGLGNVLGRLALGRQVGFEVRQVPGQDPAAPARGAVGVGQARHQRRPHPTCGMIALS